MARRRQVRELTTRQRCLAAVWIVPIVTSLAAGCSAADEAPSGPPKTPASASSNAGGGLPPGFQGEWMLRPSDQDLAATRNRVIITADGSVIGALCPEVELGSASPDTDRQINYAPVNDPTGACGQQITDIRELLNRASSLRLKGSQLRVRDESGANVTTLVRPEDD